MNALATTTPFSAPQGAGITDLAELLRIFEGSNGDATRALYDRLQELGPIGHVAVNLFRALKSSTRAKVYRGRSYKGAAYDRKQWSMDNLSTVLCEHAGELRIGWGWKEDPAEVFHRWVLYVDLPTGQMSFHTAARGVGPDYSGEWDGMRNTGPGRICRFIEARLAEPR